LRRRAARRRAWDSAVPPVRSWAGQARWAQERARTEPAAAYAALRIQWLRATEAGRTEVALALRRTLESFRLDLGPPGRVERRPRPASAAGEDRLGDLLLGTEAGRRLIDVGRAAARLGARGGAPPAGGGVA